MEGSFRGPLSRFDMSTAANDSISISKSALRTVLLSVAAVVALAVVVLVVFVAIRSFQETDSLAGAINSNQYQSVVLTSGDVYLGKLSAPGGGFYYLRHVYHLVTQQNPRGGVPTRTLTKLTSDVNSPEDLLIINRRQILFVENLNPNGKAAQYMSR